MSDLFLEFLSGFGRLSESSVSLLLEKTTALKFKKGDYFVRENEISNRIGFLVSGITRVYHFANDKEYTSYFNFPVRNRLVASFESFLTERPSRESIHFIQDAELIVISRKDFYQLYEVSHEFSELGRKLAEYNYLLAVHRIYSLQHDSAKERYLKLLNIYPALVNQVPHHYIASYLGITPESLSRLRKEFLL